MANRITLGLVGCGNMGRSIAVFAFREFKKNIKKICVFDTDAAALASVKRALVNAVPAGSIKEVIRKSSLVVEAASPRAAAAVLAGCVAAGKDVMLMSIGGVLGKEKLLAKAERKGVRIILPSGAIAGIDALKAAREGKIRSVTLTTRKSPSSLGLKNIRKETVVFSGNARRAVKLFPKNINVSALLALAGIGAVKTRVRIIASPEYAKNIHEVEIKGEAGVIRTRAENVPSPQNPKTSYLAILSARSALRQYFTTVKIGT